MNVRTSFKTLIAASALALSLPSIAGAQWDPEGGDTGQWQPPQQGQQQQQQPQQGQQWQQQQQPQQQQWQQQQPVEQPPPVQATGDVDVDDEDDGATDHSRVVGHVGVGFFGVTSVPVGSLFGGGGMEPIRVSAPTVGVRFWFSPMLGLDASIGIGLQNFRSDTGDMVNQDAQAFAFAAHVGLPISFAQGKHYKFLLLPEATVGVANGESGDVLLSGFLFQLGARIGAEIQFGFIDIPQLALQGTVGMHLNFESTVLDVDPNLPTTDESIFSIGTTVQEEPWDIFTGAITAIYYL